MSLYEALDRFVGAGVLACAGLAGAGLPADVPIDGSIISRMLRERRLGEAFGIALDALAHEIWSAQESRGFPQTVSETHVAALAVLLDKVRLDAGDLSHGDLAVGGKPLHEGLAARWLEKANLAGALLEHGLSEDLCRFLLALMLGMVVRDSGFLAAMGPVLQEYRARPPARPAAPALPPPAWPPPAAQPAALPSPATSSASAPPADRLPSLPRASAVADIKSKHDLPDGALRRLQSVLAQQALSAEQRLARLDELGGWLAATVASLRRPSNEASEIRHLKAQAASALEEGSFERAMELLKAVREHVRDARRRAESRLAEELQSLKSQMVEEATATARLGELAMARHDLDAAAEHFADAAGQLPAGETALELGYRYRRAEVIAMKAEATGEMQAIEAATTAYRNCVRLITPERDPADWARINVGLGDMLLALGARRPQSIVELDEAAQAYASAAAAIDRAVKPMQWALVQLSYAAALIELGARQDRDQRWREAAGALLPVLEVFESRGALDLAEAARSKLRMIAASLDAPDDQRRLVARRA
jgi:tetratricopeptide (TPR) repeat protein